MKATCGYITDIGRNPRRKRNEDALLVLPEKGLYLVADGVGGRRGGETASQTVVEVFERIFMEDLTDDRALVLLGAIEHCNRRIYDESRLNPELEGMATTVAIVSVAGDLALVAHVGDSRVYRFDTQGLICLTEDHSEVNDALRSGLITEEQALTHPRRNVINRAVGAEPEVDPDLVRIVLDEWTSLLICSDGVTRHLRDQELDQLLQTGLHPQTICREIRDRCYERGAEDNLTVILVDFGERCYEDEGVGEGAPASGGPADRVEVSLGDRVADGSTMARFAEDGDDGAPNLSEVIEGVEVEDDPDYYPHDEGGEWADEDGDEGAGEADGDEAAGQALLPAATVATAAIDGHSAEIEPEEETKAEFSRAMRWTLLIVPLVIGLVIGVLASRPIREFTGRLAASDVTGVATKSVERPVDPEVAAAFARHLEGRSDEARQQFSALLERRPDMAEACYYLGIVEYEQGRYDEALSRLQQAARLDPALPNVRIRLAMAYISTGQYRTARDILQQMLSPSGTPGSGEQTPGRPVGRMTDRGNLGGVWLN